MWVESLRLLPALPHDRRIAFCNGLSVGYISTATIFGFVGFYLAAGLPPLFAGALLFLTPMSFLISTANNSRMMVDKLALVLGLVLGTLLTYWHFNLVSCGPGWSAAHSLIWRIVFARRSMIDVLLELWPYGVLILVGYRRDMARARSGTGAG